MAYYVYVYFDPTRELEAFYVGKGKGERSHCHLTRTDKHPFTHRIQKMARHGVIPIIERYEGLSEEAALALEIALIAEIGRKDMGKGPLLNLTDGGEGASGAKVSDDTRKKMSVSHSNECHPFYGKHHSVETKEKIRNTKKGVPQSDEMKQKLSKARKGKKHSEAHAANLAASLKSEETRKKISEANKAHWIKRKAQKNV